ncbi:MAG: DUF6491 family protein [Asticcacaulis sp.]|uniref:DUF6491 family protein n=1 Tax=Asticcacaulis sp. TaxID=1872648 RepID=UPI0039E4B43A
MSQQKLILAGASAILAVAVVGCAAASQADKKVNPGVRSVAPNQCVSSPLEDSTVIDRETLLLTDRSGNSLILHMTGPCMTKNEAIKLEWRGTTRVCGPLDVDITGDISTVVPMRCMIDTVEPLNKAETIAYKKAH